MNWLWVTGVAIFFFGILFSIAVHEFGHLIPAKLFGVKVTQWMVGFGRTLWSRRVGDTEYGVKAIPFGGYARMIGMLPPRRGDVPGRLRRTSTGPFQGLIDSAREVALEEVGPGDEDRVFYRKRWWQKVIIMIGGPAMNFVLAALLFAVVLMGFGQATQQPVVAAVSQCVIPAAQGDRPCQPSDDPSPARLAGLAPGDRLVRFDGRPVESWDELSQMIRGAGGRAVDLEVLRDGREVTLTVIPRPTDRAALDGSGRIERVGFLGVEPTVEMVRLGPGAVAAEMWDVTSRSAAALARIPEKMAGVWDAAFGGAKREADGPIGIVGASRLGGDILALDAPASSKISFFVTLLAVFNLAIGLFNLIPLLPLDGGHIAGALWEGLRRFFARLLRRPDPGYVDVARALPFAYAMATVLIAMGALLLYADLVKPIRLN